MKYNSDLPADFAVPWMYLLMLSTPHHSQKSSTDVGMQENPFQYSARLIHTSKEFTCVKC